MFIKMLKKNWMMPKNLLKNNMVLIGNLNEPKRYYQLNMDKLFQKNKLLNTLLFKQ
jgi:hypothetical protein